MNKTGIHIAHKFLYILTLCPLVAHGQSNDEEILLKLMRADYKSSHIPCTVYVEKTTHPYETMLHKSEFFASTKCRTVNAYRIYPESETKYSPTRLFCNSYPINGYVYLQLKPSKLNGPNNFNTNSISLNH